MFACKYDMLIFPLIFILFFSSFMLQVSMNNGTTFVSSNVNITAKNCTKPVEPVEPEKPVKPEKEKEKDTTEV